MNILSPEVDAAIKEGARRVGKKFATVFYISKIDKDDSEGGRDRVWDYVSDCVQSTRLKLLTMHAEEFAAPSENERPAFAQKLATETGWELIRPGRKEIPLSKPLDSCEAGSGDDNPHAPACDDVSLARKGHRPDWLRIHEFEAEVIAAMDAQKAGTLPHDRAETLYERATRLLDEDAEWFWSYLVNSMYPQRHAERISRTQAERARFCRLKRKIGAPSRLVLLGREGATRQLFSTKKDSITQNTSPQTPTFALQQFHKSKVKLLCFTCGAVRALSLVTEVQQRPTSYISTCTLECGHSRDLEIAVIRSEAEQATFRADENRATKKTDERLYSQVALEGQFDPFVNPDLSLNETTAV
jgi:hypothetical protein